MSDNPPVIQTQLREEIQKSSGSIILMGVLLLLMGILAMGSPLVAGVSLAMMIGIMLIVGGIAQLAFAFSSGKKLSALVMGLLTVVIGGYMVSQPGAALASLTLFLAMYLIISGTFEVAMAFQLRPQQGWGLTAFSGAASAILGIMIWNQFPLSGAWAIGILIGVRMLFSGTALLMLGLAAKQK
ncbi:MAG: HdeD family acid-resistance protein [Porticoccaceae bacterium]